MSAAEYQRFAKTFVDGILDRRQPWLAPHLLSGGFSTIPTWDAIESGDLALGILNSLDRGWTVPTWMFEALLKRDRPTLIAWIRKRTSEQRRTKDEMSRLLASVNSRVLKRSLTALRKRLAVPPGAIPKLRVDDYAVIVKVAELLEPAILKVLMLPQTSRTLAEALNYLKKDHPQACNFLTRHIGRFQDALTDPVLLQRSRKNKGRARVLAEALAGADYDLTFSTSRERVRRARKLPVRPTGSGTNSWF